MGYHTDFTGCFSLNKKLDPKMQKFLTKFNETRRMKRNLDPKYGTEGEYYVDGIGDFGQDHEENVTNFNEPPGTQPSLWCSWTPDEDGEVIEWDEGEKFYYYTEWIQYLITHFLAPNGYILNGKVEWEGEEQGDAGIITIKDNKVSTSTHTLVLGPEVEEQPIAKPAVKFELE